MDTNSTKELGLTRQREVVLRAIRDAREHLTANEVFGAAKKAAADDQFCDRL
jgi:Fe2+ or Zn2+ uptake regulation protein